ncbi:MAG: TIGR03943 family putative permease subunit [Haloechinothrix sp.]
MRRETQNILLILLGGALLKLALTGEYVRYVKPVHQPWVIGGGAIMLTLGLLAIWRDLLQGARETAGHTDGSAGEPHAHSSRSSWMLLVPVLTVLLVAPPALGSDAVQRSQARGSQGQSSGRQDAAFPPLPAGEAVPLTVSEFAARAGWDDTGALDGRIVSLSGFVVHRGERVYLARMVIGCCAADASPVTVLLGGKPAAESARLADDQWIEVTGTLVPGSSSEQTGYVPELTVDSVRPIGQPADPYEH